MFCFTVLSIEVVGLFKAVSYLYHYDIKKGLWLSKPTKLLLLRAQCKNSVVDLSVEVVMLARILL